MKRFVCTNCKADLYFSSVHCLNCGLSVGFDPDVLSMVALEPVDETRGVYQAVNARARQKLKFCANADHAACNWLTDDGADDALCRACTLNDTIPSLDDPGNLEAWQEFEQAKKRLVYSILRFGLPVDGSHLGKGRLTFNFLSGAMTGHLDGTITVNIEEADSVERERRRQYFDEPYRTLLGHLRHESGHFYWSILVDGTPMIDEFRSLFGDERVDYGEALERHHSEGPPEGWQERYVSAYASAHPWEDWAETWAHYVHMVDVIETADAIGIEPRAAGIGFGVSWPFRREDAYRKASFKFLRERWVPLTIALNRLNRSMGHEDFYGFVTPEDGYKKLSFVHSVVRAQAKGGRGRST